LVTNERMIRTTFSSNGGFGLTLDGAEMRSSVKRRITSGRRLSSETSFGGLGSRFYRGVKMATPVLVSVGNYCFIPHPLISWTKSIKLC
jgi:hypothetical protein